MPLLGLGPTIFRLAGVIPLKAMRNCGLVFWALALAASQAACTPHHNFTALTEWGTPCAEYGIVPEECPAAFAGYADYIAHGAKPKSSYRVHR